MNKKLITDIIEICYLNHENNISKIKDFTIEDIRKHVEGRTFIVEIIVTDRWTCVPLKFVGKSKCHPDDEVDMTIGFDLAEYRAFKKLYKHLLIRYNKVAESYIYSLKEVVKNINYANKKISRHEELIQKYSK